MNTTIKLSFFAILLLGLFSITSCDDNLSVNCDEFDVSISYDLDTIGGTTLTADLTGGTPAYSYLWNEGSQTQSIYVLTDGTYNVIVTDADGCIASADFTVDSNGNIPCDSLLITYDYILNTSGNYAITTDVSFGTAPYTYLWSNGEITADIIVTSPGTYNLTVADANGCENTINVEISQGGPCSTFSIFMYDSVDINGLVNIYADLNNGTSPYKYLWNTGSTEPSVIPNGDGVYSVVVTDANGCTIAGTYDYIEVDPCEGFDATILAFQDSIGGTFDYTLIVDIGNGGVASTYLWSTNETTSTIIVSPSGGWSVTVTNMDGCESSDQIQL